LGAPGRRSLHPTIAILAIVVLTLALAPGSWAVLGLCALGLALLQLRLSPGQVPSLYQGLRRLRWLLISLIVVYAGFTPGPALLPSLGPASPSLPGLVEGLLRAANLVVILAAVQLMLAVNPRERLVEAVYWLLRPLRRLGVPAERFALRLVLTLEYATRLPAPGADQPSARGLRARIARLAERAGTALEQALERARESEPVNLVLGGLPAPAARDWLQLALLTLALATLVVWGPR
jgi:energy-coupling factor transport system permease protein